MIDVQKGMVFMSNDWTLKNAHKIIFVEWVTTIAVFVGCFGYLAHKIDKQSDRCDRLYEMFISAQKETKDMFIDILKEGRK